MASNKPKAMGGEPAGAERFVTSARGITVLKKGGQANAMEIAKKPAPKKKGKK